MTLVDIWEVISEGFIHAWNRLIHADLLIGLKFVGAIFLLGIAIGLISLIVTGFNVALTAAYDRYPRFMNKLYVSILFGLLVSAGLLAIGLVMILAGVNIPGTAIAVLSLLAVGSLVTAMVLRKP